MKTIREQREAAEKQVYRDYLKLAFDNEKFSSSEVELPKDKSELERYRWYVAFMLNSCDEIVLACPND